MKFYLSSRQSKDFPFCVLGTDNWNDFGHRTLFHLYYFDKNGYSIAIGDVKIMHIDADPSTKMDTVFTELNEKEFCSLGVDVKYYQNLKKYVPNYREVLIALNDSAYISKAFDDFGDSAIFVNSLLRWEESKLALKEGRRIVEGQTDIGAYNFKYSCRLGNALNEHSVDFKFDSKSGLPSRITALIGKNGTGKTQFLAKMAMDFSNEEKGSINFYPHRPSFSKVIAVSCSAFDSFEYPKPSRTFSYKFIGVRDKRGLLSERLIKLKIVEAAEKVQLRNKIMIWHRAMKMLFDDDVVDYYSGILFDNSESAKLIKNEKFSSSGQSILVYIMTDLVSEINHESLVLFDEPEIHLHPNAIANLTKALNYLLNKHESYSIVATHSPIIIQEIPSEHVYIFERENNIPIVRKLDIESFGENISVLTDHVFNTSEVKGNYRTFLENSTRNMSFDQVLSLFKNGLSFNAATYLKGVYNQKKQD